MKTYDWIVIGGGITGSALSYELIKKGLRVLLLEKDPNLNNATRLSYGGLSYWSATDNLSRELCQEGREIQQNLSEELAANTEFREVDLMLVISSEDTPETIAKTYQKFAIKPQLLTPQEACEREPLLNPNAMSGCLQLPHGHINPQKTNNAYQQAFLRLGGEIKYETVTQFLGQKEKIAGVQTLSEKHYSKNTVVCAGGLTRLLLKTVGINVNIYFTHSQSIVTPPLDIHLRTLVMPSALQRLMLEEKSRDVEQQSCWNHPSSNIIADTMEPGAIQFMDGSFSLGQISQICPDTQANIDRNRSEERIRQSVGKILPSLQNIPGKLHHCLVAFCPDSNFLVGQIEGFQGLHIFSGFTSPLVFVPPLARHFASWVTENHEKLPVITADSF
ncbi:FAD-dependent oxidoreductase [Crocosphaera sp. XPORK-15E]|uniref:NAD(P)/FAD-dependent oxidoreductase n=1 Tax=Crocosphaera sp. XPORK-15E TaxID=3110247 RepID=UPI002B20639D|nr:FAD-dependent oxidoreductase [Crocosphaera sp. XPORK-15E]MEA5536430.1 FAD-dependent oxidoreductase [Crocosphaera sp. XPORK-15E]